MLDGDKCLEKNKREKEKQKASSDAKGSWAEEDFFLKAFFFNTDFL